MAPGAVLLYAEGPNDVQMRTQTLAHLISYLLSMELQFPLVVCQDPLDALVEGLIKVSK